MKKIKSRPYYAGLILIMGVFFCSLPAYAENSFWGRSIASHRRGPGDYNFVLAYDGLARIYKVHVPAGYDRNNPLPVVIALHGGGGNAAGSIGFFKLNEKADKENFIVVYPEGTGKRVMGKVFGSWNAGGCCPPACVNKVDDVGFISKVIDTLEKDFKVDAKRIHAVGFSNGALMCYRLACELSDKIASIAVGGGQDSLNGCQPKSSVAILHFHGTKDKCAPYDGGTCGGCFADYLNNLGIPADRSASLWQCRPVPEYINEWRVMDGCSASAKVVYQKGSATCISYSQCKDNTEVVLCTLEGSGHTWPGGNYGNKICDSRPDSPACREWKKEIGEINRDLSANDMLWEFFKNHPKKE
ncbi:MAG: PHB depolymerase family esterase [Candidatus Omnitrophica bacterium]|nr:PHB depolymerase family esterase [Candidatus Omnitrophota bacterium]